MKKIIRRTLAVALSLSMVFSGFMFSASKVSAAVTDHLTDPNYNLAYQQAATMGYNSLIAGSLANLTDANLSQRVYPQPKTYGSFTIDMGKYYTVDSLDTIAFMYNESNAETWPSKAGGLILSYSQDGETFYDVKQVTNIVGGSGAWWQEIDVTDITAADVPDIDGVRFVKVTYPEQYTWGVQLREFVIYNETGTPEEAQVAQCDDPADITFVSDTPEQLKYTVVAGEDQEDYVYDIYLNNAKIANSVSAGTQYTVEDLPLGNYAVKAVSKYQGLESPGLVKNTTVLRYDDVIADTTINYGYAKDWSLDCGTSAEGSGSPTNGIISSGNTDYVTAHKGGQGGSWHSVDIGSLWKASSFETIAVWFRSGTGGTWPENGGLEFQYSPDGTNWSTVATLTQAEFTTQRQAVGAVPFRIKADVTNATGNVRYFRVYFPNAVGYGAQITEFGIFDIDGDAEPAQEVVVDDPADFTAEATGYNTITGTITAGEGQEDYLYDVYVGGELKAEDIEAGDYTITDIASGTYDVICRSHYQGGYSTGLTVSNVKVTSPEDWYADEDNVAPAGEISYVSSFYNENYDLEQSQVAVDGDIRTGEGTDRCLRTGTTQPQTIDVKLAKPYQLNNLSKVIIGYSNPRTAAANTVVSVSADGENFTQVASTTGYTCKYDNTTINANLIEIDESSTEFFQYVRFEISGGQSGWGYVVNEIGVIASEGEIPDNYMDVTPYKATTPATAPTKAGKIFAGWFEDAAFTTPYMGTTGYAYAKFIDEKALTVKFQTANDDSAVRFVSTIDNCLDYQSAGFKFTGKYGNATITEKTKTVNSVYETIKADGNTLTPSEAFENDDSAYFFTYTVRGMTDASTASTWSVTPFFVTPDGTTVEGTQGTYPPSNN